MSGLRKFILLLLLVVAPVYGQLSAELYRAAVVVENHGAQALDRASRSGLAQVMVKLSGSTSVLEQSAMRAALDNSKSYLQQYQYQRNSTGDLEVLIQYDQELVLQTLTDARQPLWTSQRPPVLIWMVLDIGGQRRFASGAESEILRNQLQKSFALRAIPVQFPLYDLEDNLNLDLHDLWELQNLDIYRASQRYGAEHVLVARLTGSGRDQWMGDWLYLEKSQRYSDSLYGADSEMVARSGVNLAAEAMAARYALVPTGNDGEGIFVQVDGIENFTAYRQVLSHLQKLELVDQARLAFLQGSSVIFHMRAQVLEQELQRIISEQGELIPEAEVLALIDAPVEPALGFRWQR